MRVLIFHGYLLRGTGSNVYNANLAPALAALGHDVHLLCQDGGAEKLDWVNSVGEWSTGGLEVRELREAAGQGSVTVYRPDIGGLLPVFVADRYKGFEVKTFPEMSEHELERYLESNVAAVRDTLAHIGGVDAALANHLIMGPVILARAGVQYAVKVHGSDLSYTVLPHRRFIPYAEEGVAPAGAVLVGSRHTAEDLWEALPEPEIKEKTRLGPPGVDLEEFAPREREEATTAVRQLAKKVRTKEEDDGFGREQRAAGEALEQFVEGEGPRVIFVGKMIVSKGADLLLAAWPLVTRAFEDARLLMIGFGEFERHLQTLWKDLSSSNLLAAKGIAARGRGLEGLGADQPLQILAGFLADPPEGYQDAAAAASNSVAFSGRLEHEEIAEVLPGADALVMPSSFPEAFGMVAVEAAACGVLPISAEHSGMKEVSRRLGEVLSPEVAPLLSFPVEEGAIQAIADRLTAWLQMPEPDRQAAREALSQRAAELWSWEGVAREVIAGSQGRLEELALVPER